MGDAWRGILTAGEHIVLMGTVKKYKGIFYRTRLLVLTDKPRLFYLEPSKMAMKGEIDLRSIRALHGEKGRGRKGEHTFSVKSGEKTYVMEDANKKAREWVEAIQEAIQEGDA